jgi:hypothetical protein
MENTPENQRDTLLSQLGITPRFADDAESPPVDKDKLRRLRDGTLSGELRDEVIDCIATFRTWFAAFGEVIDEQYPQSGHRGGS